MRTIRAFLPITLVAPQEYQIHVKLDGDQSQITITETYPEDAPAGLVDKTVLLLSQLKPDCIVEKISDNKMSLTYTGPEYVVISTVINEFQTMLPSPIYYPTNPAVPWI